MLKNMWLPASLPDDGATGGDVILVVDPHVRTDPSCCSVSVPKCQLYPSLSSIFHPESQLNFSYRNVDNTIRTDLHWLIVTFCFVSSSSYSVFSTTCSSQVESNQNVVACCHGWYSVYWGTNHIMYGFRKSSVLDCTMRMTLQGYSSQCTIPNYQRKAGNNSSTCILTIRALGPSVGLAKKAGCFVRWNFSFSCMWFTKASTAFSLVILPHLGRILDFYCLQFCDECRVGLCTCWLHIM